MNVGSIGLKKAFASYSVAIFYDLISSGVYAFPDVSIVYSTNGSTSSEAAVPSFTHSCTVPFVFLKDAEDIIIIIIAHNCFQHFA